MDRDCKVPAELIFLIFKSTVWGGGSNSHQPENRNNNTAAPPKNSRRAMLPHPHHPGTNENPPAA